MSKFRLFIPLPLELGNNIVLPDDKAHYVCNVMRCKIGDNIGVFNGASPEFKAEIIEIHKKKCIIAVKQELNAYYEPPNIQLCFAGIKKAPLEFLVQKLTELGVYTLQPIITQRTIVRDIRQDRLVSIAIEAAEQCTLTFVPHIQEIKPLFEALETDRHYIFCNERKENLPLMHVLQNHQHQGKWGIIIGPEGGFTDEEVKKLLALKNITPVSLGNRIMRAETAAIAAMTILQAVKGDI
jgi:16S rRNA (uracil1498-N3)-methyltransferase